MKALALLTLIVALALVTLQSPTETRASGTPTRGASLAETTFAVTTQGMTAYKIDGINNEPLTLFRGQTVSFNVAASGHPFYIKTARVTGSSSQYTNGVSGNGIANGTLVFVVPADAPSQLFYQCGNHSAMGATITIETPLAVPPLQHRDGLWLDGARPNPARNSATFEYSLPRTQRVYFAVFDARGRKIRTVVDEVLTAGSHFARWDGRDEQGRTAPNGVYFARLRAEGKTLGGQVVLAR